MKSLPLLSCLLIFPCVLLFFGPGAYAVNDSSVTDKERVLKAAMLLKFPLFIYWPEQNKRRKSNNGIGFCVLGSFVLNQALRELWSVEDGNYHFFLLSKISELSQHCDILFIDKSKRASLTYILQQTQDKPILTVSDITNFAEVGGIIEIAKVNSRFKIAINIEAAIAAKLKISSVLLNLSQSTHNK